LNNLTNNYLNYLPINRKEKFYTATILPGIICYHNFEYLSFFLDLINNFPRNINIKPEADNNNIQLITEFSIKESVDFHKNAFSSSIKTGETPDVVILITEPELYLIVVEAKMFSSTKITEFNSQILGQKKVIDCIKSNINVPDNNIYHIGLIPKKYFSEGIALDCQIIFWEDIINAYKPILSNNYFYETLVLAINNYESLVSKYDGSGKGKNSEDKLRGTEIINKYKNGERFWVGRNRGLYGNELKSDKETGNWKKFKYEINYSSKIPPNTNWFSVENFYNFISENTISTNLFEISHYD